MTWQQFDLLVMVFCWLLPPVFMLGLYLIADTQLVYQGRHYITNRAGWGVLLIGLAFGWFLRGPFSPPFLPF